MKSIFGCFWVKVVCFGVKIIVVRINIMVIVVVE